ncbi:short chain dehydrogenase [candidate division KSB1 bacterium]|nr:MAG: short chain dehydrogenase [candidate division KSB1 bacterium]
MNRPSKWALVTGASKGIGKATAELLAENGWGVLLVARDARALEQNAQAIAENGGQARWVAADLTRAEEVQKLRHFVQETKVPLRIVVFNAGLARIGNIMEMPVETWRELFELNVFSQVAVTQALVPLLKTPAHLVFINSVAGQAVFPQWGAYAASKFALRALADTLRLELAEQNIKVTSIFPSSTDTPLHDSLGLDWDRSKMLKPQDVAKAVWAAVSADEGVLLKEISVESAKGLF